MTNKLAACLALVIILTLGIFSAKAQQEKDDLENQNEEIKTVVHNYFETRYQSFSTLELQNIKDLYDNSIENNETLISEHDKLEIEIDHARKNKLRYLQYNFILNFKDILIDYATQIAEVVVTEGQDIVFEISAPRISSLRNLKHVITLHKLESGWKILSDTYDDYLWTFIRKTNLSKTELLRSVDETYSRKARETKAIDFSMGFQTESLISQNTYSYNRGGAVAYADQWALSRNPNYYDFSSPELGGDCTNFVSQAIKEGGGAVMAFGGTHGVGTPGWYYNNITDRAIAWTWVDGLYNFIVNEHTWNFGPEGEQRSNNEVGFGDVIQFNWDNDQIWDHSVIINNSIDMGYGNMYHLVDGHSPDVQNFPASYFDYNQVRYIHINLLRGYRAFVSFIAKSEETLLKSEVKGLEKAYPAPPPMSIEKLNSTFQAYPAP